MMPSYYWIKLYHEILDDPKMGRLPDKLWRRTIELFLIAGDIHLGGDLPAVGDMAWRLRLTEDELSLDLEQLERAGIISKDTDTYTVTNFSKRQDKVSNADRQSRYRGRKRTELLSGDDNETIKSQDSNDDVTTRNADTDTDTDKKDKEQGANNAPVNFSEWLIALDAPKSIGEKNGIAVLLRMGQALYTNFPKADKSIYGRIGKMSKKSGTPASLAKVLWDYSSTPMAIPLDYLTKVINSPGKYKPNQPVPQQAKAVNGMDPTEFFKKGA